MAKTPTVRPAGTEDHGGTSAAAQAAAGATQPPPGSEDGQSTGGVTIAPAVLKQSPLTPPVPTPNVVLGKVTLVSGAAESIGLKTPLQGLIQSSKVTMHAYEVSTAKGKLADVSAAVDEGDAIAQTCAALNIKATEKYQFHAKRK